MLLVKRKDRQTERQKERTEQNHTANVVTDFHKNGNNLVYLWIDCTSQNKKFIHKIFYLGNHFVLS